MGSGFKTFTAGSVLTASDVQNYLQDQAVMVFGGTAARSSAIGTANFEEGMLTYLTDVDKLQVYTGSSFQDVYPPAATSQGMTLINTTSFSAVASQSISSVFSSTYDNYKVELVVTNSTSATCTMRLRTSSDDTTSNYGYQHLRADATTVAATRTLSASLFNLTPLAITSYFTASIEVLSPNLPAFTQMRQLALNYGDMTEGAYFHTSTTAFTGFSLIASTGTITGKVSVYGYNL